MEWFKLSGAAWNIKKMQRDAGRTGIWIRGSATEAMIGINSNEMGSMYKIAKNVNVTTQATGVPEYKQAACGDNVLRLIYHQRACNKCRQLVPTKKSQQPQSGEVVTLIKVQGLQIFSLDGMLSVMKEQLDLLDIISGEYRTMIDTIERFPAVQEELLAAQEKLDEHKKAVAFFIKESTGFDVSEELTGVSNDSRSSDS
ncbi:hypothetical protein LCGC14_1163520 [marine sediment metagenome]|uniref:Uncharacterized protein n=1 Tax=marine sediment metagenome TaxID=412755 RepID=A0A0F9PA62_9ZZZZ